MKAVILAGGRGTRLAEETQSRPKPLVEVNGKPILWHIMKSYARYGINEFIVLVGYKGEQIKHYFVNYSLYTSDIEINLASSRTQVLKRGSEDWNISIIDSGLDTETAGRLRLLREMLSEPFLLTYGDGVANVDIAKLIQAHKKNSSLVTLTAVQPPARFGALELQDSRVTNFQEKPEGDGGWVNGGFFVVEPEVLNQIQGENESFEKHTLPKLAKQNQLKAYFHRGFWQPVDTIRDLERLRSAFENGEID